MPWRHDFGRQAVPLLGLGWKRPSWLGGSIGVQRRKCGDECSKLSKSSVPRATCDVNVRREEEARLSVVGQLVAMMQ